MTETAVATGARNGTMAGSTLPGPRRPPRRLRPSEPSRSGDRAGTRNERGRRLCAGAWSTRIWRRTSPTSTGTAQSAIRDFLPPDVFAAVQEEARATYDGGLFKAEV